MNRYGDYNRLVAMGPVKSVDELIDRIEAERMPIYQMRFFINEDRREARCFGIYFDEDSKRWIVYKNKSDGTRAIRLQTTDEAAAAQEIWAKILSEIKLRLDKGQGPTWRLDASNMYPPPVQTGNPASAGASLEDRIRSVAQNKRFSDNVITVDALKNLVQRCYNTQNISFNENRHIPGRLGIYRDEDRWIVYKNDESGRREILYEGPDEAEAVHVMRAWVVARYECETSQRQEAKVSAARNARTMGKSSRNSMAGCLLILFLFFLLNYRLDNYRFGQGPKRRITQQLQQLGSQQQLQQLGRR